ncbi:hypothetical protein [Methanoculleus sp. 7T]|uniref:hypothetical protein n=1 Tax=Methanoculleus sp. 7T TaxID=2937282 RepID=UPI0020BF8730|nr:hypothetical protein [Methanoculleus sp. 7T]MCK8519482.1 hypothetical protein [Methanoculleus sp. 7T]
MAEKGDECPFLFMANMARQVDPCRGDRCVFWEPKFKGCRWVLALDKVIASR